MISLHERSDIIHIMKMNRFALIDSDTAQLLFDSPAKEQDYRVSILVVGEQPHLIIEKNGMKIFNDMTKSIDDLKIFLEERLYKYLNE